MTNYDSACPNEDRDSCGVNGCLQFDDSVSNDPTSEQLLVCNCAESVWFPSGDLDNEQDWATTNPCSAIIANWLVVFIPVLLVILICC